MLRRLQSIALGLDLRVIQLEMVVVVVVVGLVVAVVVVVVAAVFVIAAVWCREASLFI